MKFELKQAERKQYKFSDLLIGDIVSSLNNNWYVVIAIESRSGADYSMVYLGKNKFGSSLYTIEESEAGLYYRLEQGESLVITKE